MTVPAALLLSLMLAVDPELVHASAVMRSGSRPRERMPTILQDRSTDSLPGPSSADCEWKYYRQPLSHFAEGSTVAGNATFLQRVCVIDKYWSAPSPGLSAGLGEATTGPILFYTGNEGPITSFLSNTGFVFELAQKMNGLVVFAEHVRTE